MAKAPAATIAAPASRLRRALAAARGLPGWAGRNKIATASFGIAAALIIGSFVGGTLWLGGKKEEQASQLLADALARLDAGDDHQARQIAARLRSEKQLSYTELGGPMYVLGVVTAREAQEHFHPTEQRTLYLVAARYLEEARARGFPVGRERDGLALLGRTLHHGGRYAQSLPFLSEALAADPQGEAPLAWLLADSCLKLNPPKLDQALRYTRQYATTPGLSPRDQEAGHLLESQILLAQGSLAAARQSLARIPTTSPLHNEQVVQSARLTTLEAEQAMDPQAAKTALDETIQSLRGVQGRDGPTSGVVGQAQLLIGRCYELAGDRRAAMAQYDRVRRNFFGRPEALAANVWQANLVRQEGNPSEAVALYERALAQAGPRDAYQNTWLPLDDLQNELQSAVDDLIANEHFSLAVQLTAGLTPLLDDVFATQRRIAVEQEWAKKLQGTAAGIPVVEAEQTLAQARQHWRAAGVAAEHLAELRVATRYYLDDLAACGQLYLQGQGYRQAARVYQAILRQDPKQGQPEALVGLGESLLALGDTAGARSALARSREVYPKHPATYRARLLECEALAEVGDISAAKELLLDNLYRHALTPQSTDWRDSLFALGLLLCREAGDLETKSRLAGVDQVEAEPKQAGLKLLEQSHATLQEAIRTLTEAVQRYPEAGQVVEARYKIAESYRHSAKWPRKKLGVVTIETSRLALNRQIQQELLSACDEYSQLITVLSDAEQAKRRPASELLILRNCYFGRADALFDLGRYEEAIAAYSAATNRYQQTPEALEAYVQIASCYRRLNRPQEARGTLEQARVVLERIHADADFTRTTRLDREEWTDLLAWLRTL
ncbi:MAG: tetratricopeptide repeat protein [Pirellulaceae bacterium]|nr:tetratricopeptide repeat protein [Pirellulaceae bacterium]